MGPNNQVNNLVLYDGVCRFCNNSVNFILKHERAHELLFAPLQSTLGQSVLKRFDLPENYTNSLLFLSNDKLYDYSKAAFKVAGFLKSPWRWLSAFGVVLPSFFTDFFYRLIAKHRYKLMGKSEACIVPSPDIKNRFLE